MVARLLADPAVAIFRRQAGRSRIASVSSTQTTPYTLEDNFELISTYADKLKAAVFAALEEDAILVAVMKKYHAE